MKRLKQAVCAVLAASLVAGSGFASYAGPADDIAAAEAQGTTVTYPEKTEAAETEAAPAETASSQTVTAETTAAQETAAAAPAAETPVQAAPAQIPTIDPNVAVGVGQDPAAVAEMDAKNAAAKQLAWESARELVNPIEYYMMAGTTLETHNVQAGYFPLRIDYVRDPLNNIVAVALSVSGYSKVGGISYRAYNTAGGYLLWRHDGDPTGFAHPGCIVQGMQIQLSGYMEKEYDVYYRVSTASQGMLGWAKNGEIAGAIDVEGITGLEVQIVQKGSGTPSGTNKARYYSDKSSRLKVSDGGTTYTNADGSAYNGWLDDDRKRYYFVDGKAVTGWQYIDGLKFYFYNNGVLCQNVDEIIGKQSSYLLKVNKTMNCLTVYAPDGSNGYVIPVMAMMTSVGDDTPIGTFHTPEKFRWHLMIDDSYTQWATRITQGFMMHTITYEKSDNMWMNNWGYNNLSVSRSHGCVRLIAKNAKWIYDNCAVGTAITIYEDSTSPSPFMIPDQVSISFAQRWDPTDPTVVLN